MHPVTDLPFRTFDDLPALGLEVRIDCRCGRRAVFDGSQPVLVGRVIMGAQLKCQTVLHDGEPCRGQIAPLIGKSARQGWNLNDHVLALQARHPNADRQSRAAGYRGMLERGEIGFLYCMACVPPYAIEAVAFDELPWHRYLDAPPGHRFRCPGCRKTMAMHVHGYANFGGSHGQSTTGSDGPPTIIPKRRSRNWMKQSD